MIAFAIDAGTRLRLYDDPHLARTPAQVSDLERQRRKRAQQPPKRFHDRCPHGHLYVLWNIYIDCAGYRRCRTCLRAINRRKYARRCAREALAA